MRRYAAGCLRKELTVEQAGERACALMSPELHHLLTVGLEWTPEQHRRWLCHLLMAELFDSA